MPSFVHSAIVSFRVGEQAKPPRQATRAATPPAVVAFQEDDAASAKARDAQMQS